LEFNTAAIHGCHPSYWNPNYEYVLIPNIDPTVQKVHPSQGPRTNGIQGQVDIRLAFSTESSQKPYMGYYMNPMNASMAVEYLGISDLVLSSKFSSFLDDTSRSIDLTSKMEPQKTCGLNAGGQDTSGCHRRYFIPGEMLYVAPDLLNDPSHPSADTIILSNHQGFLFDFDAGDSAMEFDMNRDCRTYSSRYFGAEVGAIRLCVGSSSSNELQARKSPRMSIQSLEVSIAKLMCLQA